jgi:hypothetical protein
MNPYIVAALLVFVGALAQFGNLIAQGVHDPLIIAGSVATAVATTIGGVLTKLPQRQWTDEERAEKLGDKA